MASVKCPKCNNLITGVSVGQTVKCPKCGNVMKLAPTAGTSTATAAAAPQKKTTKNSFPLATWKLVSGILSIILFVLVSFQSCAAGAYNALSNNGEVSGSAGIIVAIMLLAGGIVSVATRKSGKGGDIALIVLFGIGTFIGFLLAGSYSDLRVWAFWCLVCVILAIVSLVKKK